MARQRSHTQFHQAILGGHLTPRDDSHSAMVSGANSMFMQQGADPAQASAQAHGLLHPLVQRQAAM